MSDQVQKGGVLKLGLEDLQKRIAVVLGVEGSTEEKHLEIIDSATDAILKQIFLDTLDKLSDEDQEEYAKLIEVEASPGYINKFLNEKIPGYDEFTKKIVDDFLNDMKKAGDSTVPASDQVQKGEMSKQMIFGQVCNHFQLKGYDLSFKEGEVVIAKHAEKPTISFEVKNAGVFVSIIFSCNDLARRDHMGFLETLNGLNKEAFQLRFYADDDCDCRMESFYNGEYSLGCFDKFLERCNSECIEAIRNPGISKYLGE